VVVCDSSGCVLSSSFVVHVVWWICEYHIEGFYLHCFLQAFEGICFC
jgi:hypothetical protein